MKLKLAMIVALIGAAVFGSVITNLSSAQQSTAPSSFSAKQEAEIREMIADYIEQNPEHILSSVNAYAEQQRVQDQANALEATRSYLPQLVSDDGGYISGKNPDQARVAVVEFFDYHCSFCKRAADLVQDLTKDDAAVKVVFKELPILREESEAAAVYALAARDQGKYQPFHFAMLNASGTLSRERIFDIAQSVGIDVDALEARAEQGDLDRSIDENLRIAAELGLDGTPSFVVTSLDGDFLEVIPGYRPEELKAAIKEAKKAK